MKHMLKIFKSNQKSNDFLQSPGIVALKNIILAQRRTVEEHKKAEKKYVKQLLKTFYVDNAEAIKTVINKEIEKALKQGESKLHLLLEVKEPLECGGRGGTTFGDGFVLFQDLIKSYFGELRACSYDSIYCKLYPKLASFLRKEGYKASLYWDFQGLSYQTWGLIIKLL